IVQGTPTAGGPFSFVIKATDSAAGVAYADFTIHVNRLTITSTSPLPNALLGSSYGHQLTATGAGQIKWSLEPGNAVAPGLTLGADGLISGIPTSTGFYGFTVRARDASNQTTLAFLSIQVEGPLTITSTTLFDAMPPQFYSACLQSSGG